MKNKTGKKTLRLGTYSLVLCLVALAVVVALNLIVGALPSTMTKFDVSGSNLYELSAETKTICENLDSEITMYLLATRGKEDQRILTLLEKYEALSARLKLETVDPDSNPTFLSQYTTDGVYANRVLLVGANRHKLVSYNDIYTYSDEDLYNYQYYGTQPTKVQFYGESAITGAIDYLTNENLPVVYYLSGHNEADIASALSTRLTKENLTLTELNLLSRGQVPQDAACVLIGVPEYDFSADEITMLKDYMESGGSVFLLSYFTYFTEEKMPNLYAFTQELGLRAEEGLLCEEDGDHFYLTNYYLLPDLNTESFAASALSAKSIDVLLQGAQGLSETESHEGYTVTAILSSSDKAYLKSMQGSGENTPIAKEDGDRTGKFMAAAEVTASEENGGGKLFWYTSPSILSTNVSGNMELFVSNVIAVCGKTTSVTAGEARTIATNYLTVSNTQSTLWGVIVVFVIPLAALAGGIAVFVKRRKK